MSNLLESLIVIGLVIAAAITAWSVLTPNSLFIGWEYLIFLKAALLPLCLIYVRMEL